ncbi:unnamed protein product [Linum tenue]|uniref:Uncharacterized protein n=1 Tax=Linum tenue TaxID=586396 RepID=A0AAV0RL26_9ROSI|nr:unnamed protein product [Linum tenue]
MISLIQSDLLAVKNKNRRFCPIYFQKEDIDKELAKVSRVSRGVPYNITAGSLEDVLRKMEVYMLKVEGIAFRFLPDPFQIKNTLEVSFCRSCSCGGSIPYAKSDLLVVKNKNMRFCPIYFQKEEIDKELAKVSRASRGVLRNIMVGSLEDVLRKMEVQLWRKEQRSAAKLVPITFEQVSMLKVEGIAFRFLPDPVQIKKRRGAQEMLRGKWR